LLKETTGAFDWVQTHNLPIVMSNLCTIKESWCQTITDNNSASVYAIEQQHFNPLKALSVFPMSTLLPFLAVIFSSFVE